ncbi:MAG: nuclear transport factor 2 family protein [Deltaproteobacteria bacterium]|nr:nuclear transport factor 2 family protein [Deltaproteobacteria bacterium]MBW2395371.1 nuclear transport factor 2 family protein [Deltaproteobacteria bacterium]
MRDDATEITNLLYRYAECIDAGDFAGVGKLFAHAVLTADGTAMRVEGADEVASHYAGTTRLYPEPGTPKTKHVITNPILEIDAAAGSAEVRSYYTVYQQTERLPLQLIITGRYRDRVERVDGHWRFASRCFFVDQVGDLSQHLLFDLAAPGGDRT